MKNLFLVFKFEFLNLIKKKSFLISTGLICLIIAIVLTVPFLADSFGHPLFNKDDNQDKLVDKVDYGIIIEDNSLELSNLKDQLPHVNFTLADDKEHLSQLVEAGDVEVGFIVQSPIKYEYLVMNTSSFDDNSLTMDNALLNLYRNKALLEEDIDPSIVNDVYNMPIQHDIDILGKDSIQNYIYTYLLIFGLYFIVLIYGQLIATSIASEKSNRSMEILVTSTSTESLIFGKVFAGGLAGILQFGILLLVAGLSYKINANAWDNSLDFIFDIPLNVLATFSIFGILGYLFYLFSFGIIGALVSRTEDVGTSSTPIMIIFIISFFISMFSMNSPDSILLKVASFIPLSSFMAMFIRVSMGNVSTLHVIISLALLAASTGLIGVLGAKIYKLGTLMYGNPVKLRTALKMLKEK